MKKITAILLAAMFALGMTACGSNESSKDTSAAASNQAESSQSTPEYVGTWVNDNYEWSNDSFKNTTYSSVANLNADNTFRMTEIYMGVPAEIGTSKMSTDRTGTYVVNGNTITFTITSTTITGDDNTPHTQTDTVTLNATLNGASMSVDVGTNNVLKSLTMKKN